MNAEKIDNPLDPSFGKAGFAQLPDEMFTVTGIKLESDGSILVPGSSTNSQHFLVTRLLPSGEIDRSFGNNGQITGGFSEGNGAVAALASMTDEHKTVVVFVLWEVDEYHPGQTAVAARHNRDGKRDKSYAEWVSDAEDAGTFPFFWPTDLESGSIPAAQLPTSMTPQSEPSSSVAPSGKTERDIGSIFSNGALLPSGELLYSWWYPFGEAITFRLTKEGQLDKSFNDIGYARFPEKLRGRDVKSLLVLTSGKILIGTSHDISNGNPSVWAPALIRFNSDGTLDTSFGRDGIADLAASHTDYHIEQWLETSDEELVGLGYRGNDTVDRAAAIIYRNLNGSPALPSADTVPGVAMWNCGAMDGDKLVVAGLGTYGPDAPIKKQTRHPVIARYLKSGALDTTFMNDKGYFTLNVEGLAPEAEPKNLQVKDGKILLLAGSQIMQINTGGS